MRNYNKINKCRNCKKQNLVSVIKLGNLCFTGKFEKKSGIVKRAPLELLMCKNCTLVQLQHNYNYNYMYGYDYGYQTSINSTMSNHIRNVVNTINKRFNIKKNDIFVDIGSNDATLLNHPFLKKCITVGFDPIIKRLKKNYKNINYKNANFFNLKNYKKFKISKAKYITAIAMFYDLKDPNAFLSDIKKILSDDGVLILEQSDLKLMIKKNSFDTICHEHLEYYSIKVIKEMLEKNNLRIFDHEFNNINGGSSRFYVTHIENKEFKTSKKLKSTLVSEVKFGVASLKMLKNFAKKINKTKKEVLNVINFYKHLGDIHAYGASTKGNVLLQYFNLNKNVIKFVADRNPFKWKKYTPGTDIKIISEKSSRSLKPILYIVLPWHFKKEIINREKKFLKEGGSIYFPLPKKEIIKKK